MFIFRRRFKLSEVVWSSLLTFTLTPPWPVLMKKVRPLFCHHWDSKNHHTGSQAFVTIQGCINFKKTSYGLWLNHPSFDFWFKTKILYWFSRLVNAVATLNSFSLQFIVLWWCKVIWNYSNPISTLWGHVQTNSIPAWTIAAFLFIWINLAWWHTMVDKTGIPLKQKNTGSSRKNWEVCLTFEATKSCTLLSVWKIETP